jgi:hypothetical protein
MLRHEIADPSPGGRPVLRPCDRGLLGGLSRLLRRNDTVFGLIYEYRIAA